MQTFPETFIKKCSKFVSIYIFVQGHGQHSCPRKYMEFQTAT